MPHRSITQRSGVAIATATALVAFLLVNLVVSYRGLRDIVASQQGVQQATDNFNAIQAVFSALQDLETGQRGFVLTGDERYLEPFEAGLARLPHEREHLRQLVGDDARQQQRLGELDAAIDEKLGELQASIQLRRDRGFDAALEVVRQQTGQQAMDRIRGVVDQFAQVEEDRRSRLAAEATQRTRRSQVLLGLAALLGAGVIAVGFYLILREMASRLKLAEELKAADQNKNEFLALLGHELRNPLAAIRNAVDVMELLGPLPDAVDEMRAIVDRQSRTMSRLVDDLHDASRVAHGKLELKHVQIDLRQLLERTIADARSATQSSGVQIDLEIPDGDPIWVWGDATRLSQVVGNLIYNGVKFSRRGGRVLVRLGRPGHGSVELAVIDNGIGISREAIDHIFEPFSQGQTTRNNPSGGLGLGLALARGLVVLHGGEIRAHSEGRDRGATFTVRLPCDNGPVTDQDSCEASPGQQGKCRILVIDDRRDASYPLQRMLELVGHEVHVAVDGPSGIALAAELQPDVVLCDIGLPGGVSGYDVARELRGRPQTSSLLLVAVTGYGQDEARQRAATAGFDRHLTKPISLAMLQEVLRLVPCSNQGQAAAAQS
jgi:signal transduction histidine kinase/ActR/RegA family two-component response regulator